MHIFIRRTIVLRKRDYSSTNYSMHAEMLLLAGYKHSLCTKLIYYSIKLIWKKALCSISLCRDDYHVAIYKTLNTKNLYYEFEKQTQHVLNLIIH